MNETSEKQTCPACNQPIHKPWQGTVRSGLFLDGIDWYDNTRIIDLVCPVTGLGVTAVENDSGMRQGHTSFGYTFSLKEVGE